MTSELGSARPFSILPPELFLNILDQLVGSYNGQLPIAYAPSNPVTKVLRALTLVSRATYIVASRYLYSYCVHLHNCTSYARFRRTQGLTLRCGPASFRVGEPGRNDELSDQARFRRQITSMFVSPRHEDQDGQSTPMIRLPYVIDLFQSIGTTLKRLALDLQPLHAPHREVSLMKLHTRESSIFINMPVLEELIISYDVLDYFRFPPPGLKRLAITAQGLTELQEDFYRLLPYLQQFVFLRPPAMTATHINRWMDLYTGKSLDIILVDVSANHATPPGTRVCDDEDNVKIWEVDVPTSFYGDDDDLILCDNYIWTHAVNGTLWTEDKRRMASWADIEKRLAGPVHSVVDNVPS